MGAWIEITNKSMKMETGLVAPFMGAWIEIVPPNLRKVMANMSHPSWVRGLKSKTGDDNTLYMLSRTLHGCVD